MLRHAAVSTAASSPPRTDGSDLAIDESPTNYDNAKSKSSRLAYKTCLLVVCVTSTLIAGALHNKSIAMNSSKSNLTQGTRTSSSSSSSGIDRSLEIKAFEAVIDRTNHFHQHCTSIGLPTIKTNEPLTINNHTAHLPQFGFLDAFRNYIDADPNEIDKQYPYQCELPPETECEETQFTVIFMAYNPERLQKLLHQIKKMLTSDNFSEIVAEVIIVWNGERHVDETKLGKELIRLGETLPLRISYPLKAGFPNDLLNRYHPRLEIKTKAIMYYDDDGPFYSYDATLGGFELWKRNSNAQIGAMARKLDFGARQADESNGVSEEPNDRFFVSQCPSDKLHYNYFTFTNFDARMVLPSGSFLHSSYLCFIWHPIFEEIRKYVRQHPVNPDDGTVSMLVSQLAGRAPGVYPRRINRSENRRRLMDGINWDAPGAHEKKMNWGALRSDVANSLARYFGSVNSGSLGWCYGTKYHTVKKKQNICDPEMAKVGMLPWMNDDHTAGDVCH